MSFATGAVKILGMFDKVDDIIYEPVKLVCDALRTPLKMLDARNERVNAEHAAELQKQLKQFEVDLDLDRQRREMELSMDQRRLEEEINQMILDKDMARRKDMIELEKNYKKEMADAAVQLARLIASIEVETRREIFALYNEKRQEYLDMQNKYKLQSIDTIKQLREAFPDGSGEAIVQEEIKAMISSIVEQSTSFTKLMNEDMMHVLGCINNVVEGTSSLASRYFNPNISNQTALQTNPSYALEQK